MMDVISPHDHINSRMHLDTCNLRSAKLHHIVDVMDVVVLDEAEHAAHPTNNTALLTVVDVVPTDDVASHLFFQPAMILATADCITFHLSGTLYIFIGEIMVIVRIQIFSKGNTRAFAVGDLAVLNDPAFTPVRADHTILISCRRCPGGSCLCHYEAADCDIAHTGF